MNSGEQPPGAYAEHAGGEIYGFTLGKSLRMEEWGQRNYGANPRAELGLGVPGGVVAKSLRM